MYICRYMYQVARSLREHQLMHILHFATVLSSKAKAITCNKQPMRGCLLCVAV